MLFSSASGYVLEDILIVRAPYVSRCYEYAVDGGYYLP